MAHAFIGYDLTEPSKKKNRAVATLFKGETGAAKKGQLLWGDRVEILQAGASRTQVRARGRARKGWVDNARLNGQPLLEVYFIDVGQGDGVLICTPQRRHVLIDGGWIRSKQPTERNAADFVDWKFFDDYAEDTIRLDAMIASHCDADHYGGLWDLLNVAHIGQLDCTSVRVETFYHAGVSWWKQGASGRWLGPNVDLNGMSVLTDLITDRQSVLDGLAPAANPKLQGEWAEFLQAVTAATRADGQPTDIRYLDDSMGHLPGFAPADGDIAIKVLAPIDRKRNGSPVAPNLKTGDHSQNTNGNSALLRLDYGKVRILLTGDLNKLAMDRLLEAMAGREHELQCDVAKACHHGSEDVSYRFLQAMEPSVTVISSGDNEGHDHPRPTIVAASATTGHLRIDTQADELLSPLVYSTEIARSYKIKHPIEVAIRNPQSGVPDPPPTVHKGAALEKIDLWLEKKVASKPDSKDRWKRADKAFVVSGVVYGLVNVRTDGQRIVCATMNEEDYSWQVKEVQTRFP